MKSSSAYASARDICSPVNYLVVSGRVSMKPRLRFSFFLSLLLSQGDLCMQVSVRSSVCPFVSPSVRQHLLWCLVSATPLTVFLPIIFKLCMYEGPAKSYVTGITSVLRFIKHIFITNLPSILPLLKHIL